MVPPAHTPGSPSALGLGFWAGNGTRVCVAGAALMACGHCGDSRASFVIVSSTERTAVPLKVPAGSSSQLAARSRSSSTWRGPPGDDRDELAARLQERERVAHRLDVRIIFKGRIHPRCAETSRGCPRIPGNPPAARCGKSRPQRPASLACERFAQCRVDVDSR